MRRYVWIGLAALAWGALLAGLIRQPGYTDAYYYFNAGQRLVQGDGLTDTYLWTYINAPDELPGPSHAYWMPLASLVAAGSMAVLGSDFGAAQVPFVLCFAGMVVLAAWLAARSGVRPWLVAWLVMFAGFFTPFWTTTDTFALYGLVGALALVAMGEGRSRSDWRWYALSGALAALGHLARADGLLLLVVALIMVWWPWGAQRVNVRRAVLCSVAALGGYLLVMAPWFVRNLVELGSPLPTGGIETAWLRGYDQLVAYPPGASLGDFWDWGLGNVIQSRLEALAVNLGTFVAVETWVVLGPFVLWGVWLLRRDPLWLALALYALGLHLAMTFVFAFPGYRGGLFHSSAALMPFWAVAGLRGLEHGIGWLAKRRRWPRGQAQVVFNGALMVLATVLSLGIVAARLSGWNDNGAFYRDVIAELPPDAVLMVNDPAALYYHTGHGGVVVPQADPDVLPEIATQYGVTHLLLDVNRTDPFTALFLGTETRPFLRLLWVDDQGTADRADDRRLFEILPQG